MYWFLFVVEIVWIPAIYFNDLAKCTMDMNWYIFRNEYIFNDQNLNVPIFEDYFSDHWYVLVITTKYTFQWSMDLLEVQKSIKHVSQTTVIQSGTLLSKYIEIIVQCYYFEKSIKLDYYCFSCSVPWSPHIFARVVLRS